jgi:methylmalonyl-CoA mutase
VNTFLNPSNQTPKKQELIRSSDFEKTSQVEQIDWFHQNFQTERRDSLENLKKTALSGGNIFEALLDNCSYCTLGDISNALNEIGGAYRRNM